MKKLLLTITILFSALSLFALTARLSVTPSRPVAGESFMLNITVDSARRFSIQLPALPPEVQISDRITSRSYSTRTVNGRQSALQTCGMGAVVEKSGKYTIPPITLDFGGEKIRTEPLELTVTDTSQLPPENRISAELSITPEREVYVGELLRADIRIFVPGGQSLTKIPVFTPENFAGAIFLSRDNSGNNFMLSAEPERAGNGVIFNFAAFFQVQKSGNFSPSCKISLESGQDSYWGVSSVRRQVINAASTGKLTVRPVPPPPAGTVDTKLLGSWQITGAVSSSELKTGELNEVTLQFSGNTPCLFFQAPALPLTGCRSYTPEVSGNDEKTAFTVKYPFVVLKPGKFQVEVPLAVFDPAQGSYRITGLTFNYHVLPGAVAAAAENDGDVPADGGGKEENHPAEPEVLPEKKHLSDLHIWVPVLLLIIIAGSVAGMVKVARRKTPEKVILRRKLRQLAKDFDRDGAAVFDEFARDTLAGALQLENGADFHDIADRIKDRQTADFFRQVGDRAFMPGKPAVECDGALHKKVYSFIKNLPV